jgi:hypothetical protein
VSEDRLRALSAEVEAAAGRADATRLEVLAAEVEAADLDEEDRLELLGRCGQYLADLEKAGPQDDARIRAL